MYNKRIIKQIKIRKYLLLSIFSLNAILISLGSITNNEKTSSKNKIKIEKEYEDNNNKKVIVKPTLTKPIKEIKEEPKRKEKKKEKLKSQKKKLLEIKKSKYKSYNLSQDKTEYIAAVAIAEQGESLNAIKWEISLMCNRADKNANGKDPYEVASSSWFSKDSRNLADGASIGSHIGDRGVLTKKVYNAVKEVLDGDRKTSAVEHDGFSDIETIKVNGKVLTHYSDIKNRDNYIENETIIYNNNGAKYKFLGFPSKTSDPFGKN